MGRYYSIDENVQRCSVLSEVLLDLQSVAQLPFTIKKSVFLT